MDVPELIAKTGTRIATQLGVSRPIRFVQSTLVKVPTVIGFFKPVVLLPVAATTGLTMVQIEQILAHEIAHIRRHDYLVNVAQAMVETLFFFHPGVWWISAQIRVERENCCDDLAVAKLGDRLTYVAALMSLEDLRAAAQPALSANGASLITRASRLLQEPKMKSQGNWMAVVCSSFAVLVVAVGVVLSGNHSKAAAEIGSVPEMSMHQETETLTSTEQIADSTDTVQESESESPRVTNVSPENQNPISNGSDTSTIVQLGVDAVMASVNGLEIKASVIANLAYLQNRKSILEKLIERLILVDHLTELGVLPAPIAVEEEIARTAKVFGMSAEKYAEILMKNRAITRSELTTIVACNQWSQQNGLADKSKLAAKMQDLKTKATIKRVQGNQKLQELHPTVAAFVNGKSISNDEVRRECIRRMGKKQLDTVIGLTVITSAAKRRGLEVEKADIDAAIAKINERVGESVLGKLVGQSLHQQVYPSAMLRKMVEPGLVVSDQELRQIYKNNYGVRANVLGIVLNSEKEAIKVWKLSLDNPIKKHFAKLARRYSAEPSTKNNAGALPPIRKNGGRPEIENAAFKLKRGQISDVFQVDKKWVILFSLGMVHPKNPPALSYIREDLISDVKEKKIREAMSQKFDELKKSAKISRNEFSLEDLLKAPRLSTNTGTVPKPQPSKASIGDAKPRKNNAAQHAIKKKLSARTYGVADLVVPSDQGFNNRMVRVDGEWIPIVPSGAIAQPAGKVPVTAKNAKPIEDLIKTNIAPDSWSSSGTGMGTIQFDEHQFDLTVVQEDAVHEEIGDLLAKLRELDDVTIELRGFIVSCEQGDLPRYLGGKFIPIAGVHSKPITAANAKYLRSFATAKPELEFLDLPNMTVYNGQAARLEIKEFADQGPLAIEIQSIHAAERKEVNAVVNASAVVSVVGEQEFETEISTGVSGKSEQYQLINLSQILKEPEDQLLLMILRPVVMESE